MPNFVIDTAIIVELITSVPYLMSMVYLIINFTDNLRQSSISKSYIIGVAILYIAAIYNLILNGYSIQADFSPYIVGIGTFAATVLFLNKDGIKRKLLITVLLITPTLFIEIFMEIWLYFFVTNDIDSLMADPIANTYTRMFSSTFTICINVILVLFHNRKKFIKVWNSIIFLALFPIVQAMYISIILSPDSYNNLKNSLIVNTTFELLFTAMYFWFVWFISMTNQVYKKEQEHLLMAEIKNYDEKYYALVQEEMKNSRFIRHDISNYVDQVKFLINKNTPDDLGEASRILNNLSDRITEHSATTFCGEPTINMVLNLEVAKAKTSDPDIKMDITADINEIKNISQLDLSSIIFNMTDNALHATVDYKGSEKTIKINLGTVNEHFVIKIINPTINNKIEHGIGLNILHELADKYNGTFTIGINDSICTSVMTIPYNN